MSAVPLLLAGAFAVAGEYLLSEPVVALRLSIIAAAIGLLLWYAVLWIRGVPLTINVVIRKQHWIQALAHFSIFLYWSTEWPMVRLWAPLILTQLLFAYSVDMLLAWSRRRNYVLGFGLFPVIGSINLFLWFTPDWFALQLSMVALGIIAKEFVTWEKEGRRAHIFNPSAFPLAVFSLGLLVTGSTDITRGYDVATLLDVPYMYALIFLVSLPGQFFFGVTSMTMSAAATTYLFSVVYHRATGTFYFPDTFIPIAVFLGMHLLVTDPSTSPRSDGGRVVFGALYGASVVLLFAVLEYLGMPSFYDKLLAVPFLNLTIRRIERTAASWPGPPALLAGITGRQKHLAWMSVWCCGCIAASVAHVNLPRASGTTALHSAAVDGRAAEVRLLLVAGADPNAVDDYGTTPLSLAVLEGRAPLVSTLVRAGGHVNATGSNGLTMLMLAARSSADVTEALVRSGAEVNAQDASGQTALMWSARAGNTKAAQTLIDAGADVHARDRDGKTALAVATENGDTAMAGVLRASAGRSAAGETAEGKVVR